MKYPTKDEIITVFRRGLEEIDSNKFSYASVFGSLDPRHDLDTIVVADNKTSTGEFAMELMSYAEAVKKVAQTDYGINLTPFPLFDLQTDVTYFGKPSNGVLWHMQTYVNTKDLVRKVPHTFIDQIDAHKLMEGELEETKEFVHTSALHYYFTLINSMYPLFTEHPEEFADMKSRMHLGYVSRYAFKNRERKHKNDKVRSKDFWKEKYREYFIRLDEMFK